MKTTTTSIQQRKHGSKYRSSNLPSHTPIIGLGCSSFSTFFIPNNTCEKSEGKSSTNDGNGRDGSGGANSSAFSSITTDDYELFSNITQATAKSSIDQINTNYRNRINNILNKGSNCNSSKEIYHPIIQQWTETIQYAVENGITLLDTAPWYGHGTSEVIIGLWMSSSLSSTISREDIVINTKVGRYDSNIQNQFNFSYDSTIHSVHRSIERMECAYIDVIQLHDPEFAPNMDVLMEETIPAMLFCRDELKVARAIGLTGYPLEVQYAILKRAMDLHLSSDSSGGGAEGFVFDQCLTYCHFNLHSQALFTKPISSMDVVTTAMTKKVKDEHDREIHQESNHFASSDNNPMTLTFAQYCHSKSIPLMAAAPLSMGLLTHSSPPSWHPAPEALKEACKRASDIAKSYDVDLPTLALLFALVNSRISCTLLGMANKEEVDVALKVVKRIEKADCFEYDDGYNFEERRNSNNSRIDEQKKNKNETASAQNKNRKMGKQVQAALIGILTSSEKTVLDMLLDEINGPFANVWLSSLYEWDGMMEADKFWLAVSGGISSDKAKCDAAEKMKRHM